MLADAEGPLDTSIASSRRGSIEPDTSRAWLVVNLPARQVSADQAHADLEELLRAAPVNESHGCDEDLRGVAFRAAGNEPFWSAEIASSSSPS